MIDWNFNPQDYNENTFAPIPEGDHRCRIEEVVEKKYSSGKTGLQLTLAISGYNSKVWFYLVLDPANVQRTNQTIGSIYSSFGITDTNLSHYASWVGKVGACRIKHEEYNGEKTAKVRFFLTQDQATKKNLPAWKEPEGVKKQDDFATAGFTVTADDVPF